MQNLVLLNSATSSPSFPPYSSGARGVVRMMNALVASFTQHSSSPVVFDLVYSTFYKIILKHEESEIHQFVN